VMLSHNNSIAKRDWEVNLPNPFRINDLRYAL
jgi:hypothetical protein